MPPWSGTVHAAARAGGVLTSSGWHRAWSVSTGMVRRVTAHASCGSTRTAPTRRRAASSLGSEPGRERSSHKPAQPDDVAPTLHLLVEAFEGVRRRELAAQLLAKGHEGEPVVLGGVHELGRLIERRPQALGHLAPPAMGIIGGLPRERGADHGGDHRLLRLGHAGEELALDMDAAALGGGTQHLAHGGLEALPWASPPAGSGSRCRCALPTASALNRERTSSHTRSVR